MPTENAEVADWLERLTQSQRSWGFGLCFLYLRNVKGYQWNHKRVYRIYRELELNLRIKPKKRLVREKPEPLAVPAMMNKVWSMCKPPSISAMYYQSFEFGEIDDIQRASSRRENRVGIVRCNHSSKFLFFL